jgi:uncharacterized membrane protein YtjA (UPF0391 family)
MVTTAFVGDSPAGPRLFWEYNMLRLAIVFLVIALIAALVGFGGVESIAWGGAKILFFIFIVLAVLSFLGNGYRRGTFWG